MNFSVKRALTPDRPPRKTPDRGLWAAWILWSISFWTRLLQSPSFGVADEELYTPTAAALLAGHFDPRLLLELQYTSFCGGCTAETLIATPLFAIFGPGLIVWKMIPWAFGIGILALLWKIGEALGGRSSAALACFCWILGPTWLSVGSTIAFGSHYEVSLLTLGALFAALRSASEPGRAPILHCGLLSGLAIWFDYAALPIVLITLLLAFVTIPPATRRSLFFGLGLGLLPLLLSRLLARSGVEVYGKGLLDLLSEGPGLDIRLSELLGPVQWASAWYPTFGDAHILPGFFSTLGAVGVSVGILLLGPLFWLRADRRAAGILALAAMIAVYALAYLLLAPSPPGALEGPLRTANGLRYLQPLGPLVALAFGLVVTSLSDARRWAGALFFCLVLPGVGLSVRLAELDPDTISSRGLHLHALDRAAILGRLRPAGTPDREAPLPAWLDALELNLQRLPAEGEARTMTLGFIGYHGVAPLFELDRPPTAGGSGAVLQRIADLDPTDREALLFGAATHLWESGGWVMNTLGPFPERPTAELLRLADPETASVLCRMLLRGREGHSTIALREALLQGRDPFGERRAAESDWDSLVWRVAVARTVGRTVVADLEAADQVGSLLPQADLFDDAARQGFLEGIGEAAGARFGHEDLGPALSTLPVADRAPIKAGAARGWAEVQW